MLKIKVQGLEKVFAELRDYERKANQATQETVELVADATAKDLANKTFPRGTTNATRDVLTKSIAKDVNKAYADDSRIAHAIKLKSPRLAAAYMAAREAGKDEVADSIAKRALDGYAGQGNDSGQHLESLRTKNGRVPRPQQMRMERAKIEEIKAKKILTAGVVKSGWLQCARNARIPVWLRKALSLGERTTAKLTVTLTNRVKYAGRLINNSLINRAIVFAFKNQLKRLQKTL